MFTRLQILNNADFNRTESSKQSVPLEFDCLLSISSRMHDFEMSISDSCATTSKSTFGTFPNLQMGESVEFRKKEGQKSVIVGSSFSKSENGLYGLLMRDTNDHHQLTSLNCTFVDNIRTFTPVYVNAAPIENEAFTDRQISTDNDITFKKCTFTSCSAPTGQNGGAILHIDKGSLAIESCTFTSCRASLGPAVLGSFQSTDAISGLFRITGSHINRCGSATSYSAVLFKATKFTYPSSRVGFCIQDLGGGTVHNCRFVNLTVTKEMQAGCKVEGANGDVSASDCYFSEMFNYTSGAYFPFKYIYGQTKVERMRFIECHPNLAAGGSALIVAARTNDIRPELPTWYAEIPNDNPVISDCWFEATEKASLADLPRSQKFGRLRTLFNFSWEGTAINTIRQTPKIVIDEQAGVDEEFCWMRENGCRTMSETINDRTSGKFEGTFLLVSDSHSDSGVEVGQRKLVMKSQPETKATISDEGSSAVLFSISTGSLDLSSVDFSPHIESRGTTTLTSLTLQSMTSTVGLIAATSGSDFSRDLEIDLLFLTRRVGVELWWKEEWDRPALSRSPKASSQNATHWTKTTSSTTTQPTQVLNLMLSIIEGSLAFVGQTVNAGTVDILSTNFSDCSCANSSGASINVRSLARLFITSCRFHNQFASGFRAQGGAISGWIISDVSVVKSCFTTCQLSDHTQYGHGGAITFQGSDCVIDFCQFEDCSAPFAAHAIHISEQYYLK
ncbi:hypothetical protein BLNAU_24610 [Blattamonas nauphoetae]|uniref:Right handed beta helix domain-containing protein n=1 Tax=Blattamonas nauphoetae TaxID=2049346 RepID=A0ABQ9WLY5_9EUKA|nr:hypothetical protein BLNAU_24610 [Blattamonas nauphoetae]